MNALNVIGVCDLHLIMCTKIKKISCFVKMLFLRIWNLLLASLIIIQSSVKLILMFCKTNESAYAAVLRFPLRRQVPQATTAPLFTPVISHRCHTYGGHCGSLLVSHNTARRWGHRKIDCRQGHGLAQNFTVAVSGWRILRLWWASQAVGKATMTETEVSISMTSWWHKVSLVTRIATAMMSQQGLPH